MKVKSFNQFTLHIFLLPVFFIWHIYNEYLVTIQASLYLKYLGIYLLLSLALFTIGKLFYKNIYKAGCWTTCLLIPFFFWGYFIDMLRALPGPRFLSSYSFLLPLFFILIIVGSLLLRKRNPPFRLNFFLNTLFSVFILIEVLETISTFINKGYLKKNMAFSDKQLNIKLESKSDQLKPDIFFIVFDEYASSKALKDFFNFDNSLLDSSLTTNGFFISTGSQSNYNSTTLSIATTLNMQYISQDLENLKVDGPAFLKGVYTLKKSFLPHLLEQNGYQVFNYGLLDFDNHPAMAPQPLEQYKIDALSLETFWGRVRKEIYWHITVNMPGYTGQYPPDMDYINRNINNYRRFKHELNTESPRPRFVFSHLLLPRRPAYVDRHGKPRYISQEDYEDERHDSLYLEQLRYANVLIDSLAGDANKPRKRPLVVIVEGDHGNRYSEKAWGIREKHFRNLNAYYFSDHNYSLAYDTISPVNTFRVVLNKYFNTNLPLLKDSTVFVGPK